MKNFVARPWFLGIGLVLAACSSSSKNTGGSNADSGVTNDGGSGDDSSSSGAACAPKGTCTAAEKTCIGLVDNSGKTAFGLRMSELDLTAPQAFTTGIIKTTVGGAVGLDLASCNLSGSATFSWLLQFDTTAMTLKTGGAKPVADPTTGFAFDNETIGSFHVQPVVYTSVAPDTSGHFSTTAMDLNIPIFLNNDGTSSVLLPLHQASFTMATLSDSNNCIGTYNAAGLDPANSCNPDSTHAQFIDAASVSAYITLAEADTVIVTAVNESLCALLAGSTPGMTMTNSDGVTVCATDADGGTGFVYQGHWCSTTNSAATAECADAEQFLGNFAASSVLITN